MAGEEGGPPRHGAGDRAPVHLSMAPIPRPESEPREGQSKCILKRMVGRSPEAGLAPREHRRDVGWARDRDRRRRRQPRHRSRAHAAAGSLPGVRRSSVGAASASVTPESGRLTVRSEPGNPSTRGLPNGLLPSRRLPCALAPRDGATTARPAPTRATDRTSGLQRRRRCRGAVVLTAISLRPP
jgi:hypothetical protein